MLNARLVLVVEIAIFVFIFALSFVLVSRTMRNTKSIDQANNSEHEEGNKAKNAS